jgi:hypothetical protein
MENMGLLKAMQEMMERQIVSLSSETRSGQDKMDANQARMEK